MRLTSIETGYFKLDGGAMFGVVPKTLWNRLNPADENNRCTWSARCLLVENGKQLILIDTGLGNKQDDKFKAHFEPHGDAELFKSIVAAGYHPTEVTDVLLTHLHFDHCGGAVVRKGNQLMPAFENARYHVHEKHWHWATHPNPREKASFLSDNILPLQQAGVLSFIQNNHVDLFPGIELLAVDGHTEKMLIPIIQNNGQKIAFCADLIPSKHHVALPWVMAYDVRPLKAMQEKEKFLKKCLKEDILLFFEHDPKHMVCTLQKTERGIQAIEVDAI